MDQFHGRSLRNPRGGRRVPNRDKRKYESGGVFSAPKSSESREAELRRVRGGNYKVKLRYVDAANVVVDKGRVVEAKIQKVVKTPDNRNYARLGFITKGSIILTEVGEAKVINRPSQDGVVNAILISKNNFSKN